MSHPAQTSTSTDASKSIVHCRVPFSDLYIDRRELYIQLGYGEHTPDEVFLGMIDDMLVELEKCCTPEFGYVIQPGHRLDRETIRVGDVDLNPGRVITSSIREAEQFVLFTATVGAGFDEWNHALQKQDDMVRIFFADSLGSILAEACGAVMIEKLERDMTERGLSVSNSYSPGYCDWRLVEQKKLFSFFPEGFCGVKLTDSCLMLPIKSISGIIGIGDKVKKRPYGCEICEMQNCIRNKKKNHQ